MEQEAVQRVAPAAGGASRWNSRQLTASARRSCEILPGVSWNFFAAPQVVSPVASVAATLRLGSGSRLSQAPKSNRLAASSAGVQQRYTISSSFQAATSRSCPCSRSTAKPCWRWA